MKPRVLVPVALILAVAAPASATHEGKVHTARGKSTPIYTGSIVEHYWVPTDWGTIYGAVRRPVVPSGVKVPVILTYSPYNTLTRPHNTYGVNDAVANYYVPRGYARALFDLVGTRESGGCYDFGGAAEGESGATVVDFLGTRSWSNGKVGMVGVSYDGTTQYAVAIEAPEHLTTIVPQVAIDRWWDYPYEGGIRRFSGFGTPLLFDYGFGFIPPTDPTNPEAYALALAGRIHPCERALNQVRGYGFDPSYDGFWAERDYRARARDVEASVMIEGGWGDTNVQPIGSTRFFQALPEDHPKRLVIGPWGHAPAGYNDSTNVRHAWFDHWLLGLDTGVMALPRVDSQASGNPRVQEDHWPPELTREATIGLVSGTATTAVELGLDGNEPTWVDDEAALAEPDLVAGDCGDACVILTGVALDKEIRISGTPMLQLEVSATAPLTLPPPLNTVSSQVAAVLFYDEGGSRTALTRGMLNFRNRRGIDRSEDSISGRFYPVTIELDDLDRRVPAGARLGIALASHNRSVALFPDDDTRATLRLRFLGKLIQPALRLPVSLGHTAVGLPDPEDEEEA